MLYVQVVRFRWLTWLPWVYYNHASLIIDDVEFEATPMNGVFSHEWIHPEDRMGTDQGLFGSFQIVDYALLKPTGLVDVDMVRNYAYGQTGKHYAWHWVLYLAWDVLTDKISEQIRRKQHAFIWGDRPYFPRAGSQFQVCTSFVADCLEYAQYPVVEGRLVLPDAFCKSKRLEEVDLAPLD